MLMRNFPLPYKMRVLISNLGTCYLVCGRYTETIRHVKKQTKLGTRLTSFFVFVQVGNGCIGSAVGGCGDDSGVKIHVDFYYSHALISDVRCCTTGPTVNQPLSPPSSSACTTRLCQRAILITLMSEHLPMYDHLPFPPPLHPHIPHPTTFIPPYHPTHFIPHTPFHLITPSPYLLPLPSLT